VTGEQHVAGDDRLFRHRGPAAHPEDTRHGAFVHLGVLGEPWLLGVLGHDTVEGLDVLQCASHEHRVGDAYAVVGEHPDPCRRVRHRAELGQALTCQSDRDRSDRSDVDVAGSLPEVEHLLDDTGRVGDRVGVGHRVDRGEATECSGAGAGRHGLGVLAAGLTQVGVQVDQAGQGDEPVGVDGHRILGRRTGVGDHPVLEDQVLRLTAEDTSALDHIGRAHPATSSSLWVAC
jgi:hypothetical protein